MVVTALKSLFSFLYTHCLSLSYSLTVKSSAPPTSLSLCAESQSSAPPTEKKPKSRNQSIHNKKKRKLIKRKNNLWKRLIGRIPLFDPKLNSKVFVPNQRFNPSHFRGIEL